MTRKSSYPLLLLFLFVGLANGQTIKIKKDVVYVDKQPSFMVAKTSAKDAEDGKQTITFLDMGGDTLVHFRQGRVTLPTLNHEKMGSFRVDYYQTTFAGSDLTVKSKFLLKKLLADALIGSGVIANGQLDPDAIPAYVETQKEVEAEYGALVVAKAHRETLLENDGYKDYQKKLVDRNLSNPMACENGNIYLVSQIQSQGKTLIGTYKVKDGAEATSYSIFAKDKTYLGMITGQKNSPELTIRSAFDNRLETINVDTPTTLPNIQKAMTYMMRWGYL